MRKIARKNILKIKPYIPGKPIEELERELGLQGPIKLASNENVFPPPASAVKAAKKALLSVNRYPDGGCFYLKRALAKRLRVKPENIMIGNGSDEIIILALRAFLRDGEEVIIAKPTFLIYEIASEIHGAGIKFSPLKDLRYDVRNMARLITKKTKLIFIANPDNPTGTYVTQKEIDFLISRMPEKTILFLDEAYFEFAKNAKGYPDAMKYLLAGKKSGKSGKKTKNIIITRTFSKIYSMAGLRVGYGIARKEIVDCLNRVREPFNVNSVAQAAALAALNDERHVRKTLSLIKEGKNFICRELERLGLEYVAGVTNFVLVNVRKDSKDIYKKLLKQGIIVREMSPWKLNNFIRVTIGRMSENRKFIRALSKIVKRGKP